MTKKLIRLFLLLLIPTLASAQGSFFSSSAQRTIQNFIAPIPGALITVCSSAGTGTPCSPTTPIYLDAGLTQQIPGSAFTADTNGNFGFYAPPGTYTYSITATGVTGQLFTAVLPFNTAANLTFTGTDIFTKQIISNATQGTAPFSVASTTLVANLNAGLLGGFPAPASAIVGINDTQTLTAKTLASPTINTPTLDGTGAAHAASQVSAATNFGTALASQTVVSSLPSTGMVSLSFNLVQVTAGVGCSASTNSVTINLVSYTTQGGSALTFNPSANMNITGNGAVDNGEPGSGVAGFNDVTTFAAKGGTSLSYTTTSTLGSTGCTTTPQYTIFVKAFF